MPKKNIDYHNMSDEELNRLELVSKAEERDKIESYKKTGKKVLKWYLIGAAIVMLFLFFIIYQLFSSLSNY